MEKLLILLILLLFVGFIIFNIVRNRQRESRTPFEKTVSVDPIGRDESMPQRTPSVSSDPEYNSCALAITLRIVGVINVFAALIFSLVLAEDFGWIISIAVILSGCLGCLFCYALAKCVDAADKYLNNH